MHIDKKICKKTVIIVGIIVALFIGYNVFLGTKEGKVNVKDYMPNEPIVKIFEGDYDGTENIEVVDKVAGEYYQKKSIDSTNEVVGVTVYKVDKNGYKQVYRDDSITNHSGDFLKEESNINSIFLKAPVKDGISWINDDGSTYKILNTNEKRKLLGRTEKVIKLRYRKDEHEYYIYFAKHLGIVEIDTEMGNSKLKEIKYNVEDYLK